MSDTGDIATILDAKIPIISIESPDERRVLALLCNVAKGRGLAFYEWSATRGLHCGGEPKPDERVEHTDPESALRHIATMPGPALYAFCDLQPFLLDEPSLVRRIKDIALEHEHLGHTLVLLNNALVVPSEIIPLTASFELSLPTDDALRAMVRTEAQLWAKQKWRQQLRLRWMRRNHHARFSMLS